MCFSRESQTGHTVVFINWLRDSGGRIIGVHYWSSQGSTNGIAYKNEYFNVRNAQGQKYGNVMLDSVFIPACISNPSVGVMRWNNHFFRWLEMLFQNVVFV